MFTLITERIIEEMLLKCSPNVNDQCTIAETFHIFYSTWLKNVKLLNAHMKFEILTEERFHFPGCKLCRVLITLHGSNVQHAYVMNTAMWCGCGGALDSTHCRLTVYTLDCFVQHPCRIRSSCTQCSSRCSESTEGHTVSHSSTHLDLVGTARPERLERFTVRHVLLWCLFC